jgi:hypothetical protein
LAKLKKCKNKNNKLIKNCTCDAIQKIQCPNKQEQITKKKKVKKKRRKKI